MKKICIIQQECGIGDVFFCQNIAKKYIEDGYEIIWPLSSFVYKTIPEHLCISGVNYYDNNTDFPFKNKFQEFYHLKTIIKGDNFIFLPLGWSQHVKEVRHERTMTSKYAMCGMNYKNWKDNIKLIRNEEREAKLYTSLNLKENDSYYLINNIYATPPDTFSKDVSSAITGLDVTSSKPIEMKILSEFSVFDWCKVIENAKYIITVDTCIMYFMEFLNLKSEKNCCFLRNGNHTFYEINDLFETPWTYYK